MALLEERDTAPQQSVLKMENMPPIVPQPSGVPKDNNSARYFLAGLKWPPIQLVDQEDEGWDATQDADSDDEGWLGYGTVSDTHVEEILQTYLSNEEDPSILRALEAEGISLASVDTARAHALNKNAMTEMGNESEVADGAGDRHLALNSSAMAERIFQRHVSYCPTQCLRYAYDGKPLWCTAPSPPGAFHVPPCEACGVPRVFEVQLMPGILALSLQATPSFETQQQQQQQQQSMKATRNNPDGKNDGKGGEQSDDKPLSLASLCAKIDDGGLDYGVAAIYVCPNSCVGGKREVVIVQTPPDIAKLR
jgi:hypothetical protein